MDIDPTTESRRFHHQHSTWRFGSEQPQPHTVESYKPKQLLKERGKNYQLLFASYFPLPSFNIMLFLYLSSPSKVFYLMVSTFATFSISNNKLFTCCTCFSRPFSPYVLHRSLLHARARSYFFFVTISLEARSQSAK